MGVDYHSKPPLGLRPRYVVDRDRALEILTAFYNYFEAGKAVEDEWINELREINDRFSIKKNLDSQLKELCKKL